MCNTFGDPVCASHEPRLRARVDEARTRVSELSTELDAALTAAADGGRYNPTLGVLNQFTRAAAVDQAQRVPQLRNELAAARDRLVQARGRHDQTDYGLARLIAAINDPTLTLSTRARAQVRLSLAQARRAAAETRWKKSAAWAEERLRGAHPYGDQDRFTHYANLVIARRAAEHDVRWPPPTGAAAAGWEATAAAHTLTQLRAAGAPHPEMTFMVPDVIDAAHRTPTHPGWSPLLAAHHIHLPTAVRDATLTGQLHRAAYTGRAVVLSGQHVTAEVRACGQVIVDDDKVISVHDAAAGDRWHIVPLVGPLQLATPTGEPVGAVQAEGVAAVRDRDNRFTVTRALDAAT